MSVLSVGQKRNYRIQKDAMSEFRKGHIVQRRGFYRLNADTLIWFPKLRDGNIPQSPFGNAMLHNGDIEETCPNDKKFKAVIKYSGYKRVTFPADPRKPYHFEGVYEVKKVDAARLKIIYQRVSTTCDTSKFK